MKIQNLVVNHKSRPFKSNPVIVYTKYLIVFLIGVWESAETRIYFCSRPSKIKWILDQFLRTPVQVRKEPAGLA